MVGVKAPKHEYFTIAKGAELYVSEHWEKEGYVPQPSTKAELAILKQRAAGDRPNLDAYEFHLMEIAQVGVRDLPRVYLDAKNLRPVPPFYYDKYVIIYVLLSGGTSTNVRAFFEHHLACLKEPARRRGFAVHVSGLIRLARETDDVGDHTATLDSIEAWCTSLIVGLMSEKNAKSDSEARPFTEADQFLLLRLLLKLDKSLNRANLGVSEKTFIKLMARLLSRHPNNVKTALGPTGGKESIATRRRAIKSLKDFLVGEKASGSALYSLLDEEQKGVDKPKK